LGGRLNGRILAAFPDYPDHGKSDGAVQSGRQRLRNQSIVDSAIQDADLNTLTGHTVLVARDGIMGGGPGQVLLSKRGERLAVVASVDTGRLIAIKTFQTIIHGVDDGGRYKLDVVIKDSRDPDRRAENTAEEKTAGACCVTCIQYAVAVQIESAIHGKRAASRKGPAVPVNGLVINHCTGREVQGAREASAGNAGIGIRAGAGDRIDIDIGPLRHGTRRGAEDAGRIIRDLAGVSGTVDQGRCIC